MLRKTRNDDEGRQPSGETTEQVRADEDTTRTSTGPMGAGSWDRMLNILIGGLSVLVVALLISLIVRLNSSPSEPTVTVTENPTEDNEPVQVKSKVIRVEVLNGTTVPKLASRASDFLREKGFDVVQTGNAPHSNFKTSVVQDRMGNIQNAMHVAQALGIGESAIIQQKNPQLYLEVTVIIGMDYKSLKFMGPGR